MPPVAAAPEETEEDIKPAQPDRGDDVQKQPDARTGGWSDGAPPEQAPSSEKPDTSQPLKGASPDADNYSVVHEATAPDQSTAPVVDRGPGAPPVQPWHQDDADARHQDVYRTVDKQMSDKFNQEHPFAPSGWQPATPPEVYDQALRQSDKEAQSELRAKDSSLEAQMRGTGQKYYRDADGTVQPVIDQETGKPLYETSAREQGINPDTKQPAWVKRDKYGQKQYETPPLVSNPSDPTDKQLYYNFGDGKPVPAGNIDDLVKSKDFKVARIAIKARNQQRAQVWKEAIAPMQDVLAQTNEQFANAQQQHLDLGTKAEQLQAQIDAIDKNPQASETTGGVMGFGGSPSDAATQLQSQRAQLQNQLEQTTKAQSDIAYLIQKPDKTNQGGPLWKRQNDAKLHLAVFKAKAAHDNYADLADERRAILKEKGIPEAGDTILQSIKEAQQAYGQGIDKFGAQAHQAAQAPVPDAEAQPAETGVSQEPYQLAASGVKGVGGVSVQALARNYGSGQGSITPASVLKISQRVNDIKDMLADKKTADAMKPKLQQESDYLGSLFAQRLTKLPPDDQKKITDLVERQNIGGVSDTARRFVKGVVEAPGMVAASAGRLAQGAERMIATPIINHFLNAAEAKHGPMTPDQKSAAKGVLLDLLGKAVEKAGGTMTPQGLIKGGEAVKALANKIQVNPNREDSAAAQLAEGAGNVAGSLPVAVAGAPGAVMAGSGLMREQTRDQALAEGDSQDIADAKGNMAALAGGILGLVPGPHGTTTGIKASVGRVAAKGVAGAATNALADVALQKASTGKIDWNRAGKSAQFGGIFGALFALPEEARGRAQARIEEQAKQGSVDAKAAQAIIDEERAKAASSGASLKAPEEPAAVAVSAPEPTAAPEAKKSAVESAKVFEPALNEQHAPPAKAAAESAAVFNREAQADKLVDKVAEVSGQPKDEILKQRGDKTVDEWTKHLQSEEKYHKNPLIEDPERRSTELRSQLEKANADWQDRITELGKKRESGEAADGQQHAEELQKRRDAIEKELTTSERLRQSPQGGEPLNKDLAETEAQQQKRVDDFYKAKGELLQNAATDLQTAINGNQLKGDENITLDHGISPAADAAQNQLTALDVKFGEGVGATKERSRLIQIIQSERAKVLGEPTKLSDTPTREATDAELAEAKKNAAPGTIVTRASEAPTKPTESKSQTPNQKEGGEEAPGAAEELPAPKPLDSGGVAKLGPKEFTEYTKQFSDKGGFTTEAHRLGIAAKGDDAAIAKIDSGRESSIAEFKQAMKDKKIDEALALASKAQFFREAKEAATGTVSAAEEPISPSVSTEDKSGQPNKSTESAAPVPTEKELKPLPEGTTVRHYAKKSQVIQGHGEPVDHWLVKLPGETKARALTAEALAAEGFKAPEITEAPANKHGEIEGDKINKEWTQFAPESKGLGVPRAEMPQVKAEHRGALVNFLKGQGVESKSQLVRPTDLKPSQNEYSEAKVEKARGFEGGNRSILVSSDNHVIDGHHQWVAALHDEPGKPIKVIKIDALAKDLIEKMKQFPSAETSAGATKPTPVQSEPENGKGADVKVPGSEALSEKPNVAGMKIPELLAELDAGGVKEINGKPVGDAKGAELMNAVFKMRKAQEAGSAPASGIRISDKLISGLEALRIHKPGMVSAGTPFSLAWDGAIDTAILAIKTGRTVADAVKFGINRLKEKFPNATDEHLAKFESAIRGVYDKQPEAKPAAKTEPTKPAETTGIAHRVSEARGVAAERGEGISTPDSIQKGRGLIKDGYDVQKAVEDFQKTKAVSSDLMAAFRAHEEQLSKAVQTAQKEHGMDSPEAKAAWDADKKWLETGKEMQTEWHKTGQAQQGETEVDTGTFHGLQKAYFEASGKDFTKEQADKATKIADDVKGATDEAKAAQDKVLKTAGVEKATKESAEKATAKVKARTPGTPWKPDEAKALWHLAKANYLDKGIEDINDIRAGLATDLGLSKNEVFQGLASPKGVRDITNDMYAKMAARRRVIAQAKEWVAEAKYPGYEKFFRAIPGAFFNLATFGHGTVWTVTHAGNQYFLPKASGELFKDLGRSFKLMGVRDGGAYHERMMQDLIRDPNFVTAKRAGLANDPFKYQDDYQNAGVVKVFKNIGLMGNRGFDGMKLFRQFRFNQEWSNTPESLKTPEYAKLLADRLNKATGITKASRLPAWMNTAFFAPKLEMSRWAFLYSDPVKDALTIAKGLHDKASVTPEAYRNATRDMRQKVTMAGAYLGALALNQALLSATGSKQSINLGNPRSGDWLSFKGFGHNFGVISPMINSVRFLQNIAHDFWGERSKLEQLQATRGSEAVKRAGEYARVKLSPFANVMLDVASQSDAFGRPMPWSNDPLSYRAKQTGSTSRYSYLEYASKKLLPIPLEEAATEIWKSQGATEDQVSKWLRAIAIGVAAGSTGVRVTNDISGDYVPRGAKKGKTPISANN